MHSVQTVAEPAQDQDTARDAVWAVDCGEMYPKEHTKGGLVKHSRHCKATFRRNDWSCHRCVELMLGAAPRDGWQHDYFAKRLGQRQRRLF